MIDSDINETKWKNVTNGYNLNMIESTVTTDKDISCI